MSVVPIQRGPSPGVAHTRLQDGIAAAVAAVLGVLPLETVRSGGSVVGWLCGALAKRKRHRARVNLELAGSADPGPASRLAWKHFGTTFAEMLWMTSQNPDTVAADLEIEGLDLFREAHASGRGSLLVSAHTANWEFASLAASRAGVPIGVIAREMRVPRIERRIVQFRERAGIRTLVRGRPGASLAAARLLKTGGILGCMMDRISSGSRLAVPFLGLATYLPLGPVELAARTGARIVVGCARRGTNQRTQVVFRDVPTGDVIDREALAWRVGRALEEEVGRAPEQWLWICRRQRRWNGRTGPVHG